MSAKPVSAGVRLRLTDSERALMEAVAAALGGVVSTVLFYPLDTAKTRYQGQACASRRSA
eukprot:869380-Prorocentrum_minimum.AAC.6